MAKEFAHGTKLEVSTDSGTTWTRIAMVEEFPFPNTERDVIDVTNHDSPNGYEETMMGLKRSGEIAFRCIYDPSQASHNTMWTLLQSGDTAKFRIEMVDIITPSTGNGTRFAFDGQVRRFQPRAPLNDVYRADVAIKVTGDVVKTAAV